MLINNININTNYKITGKKVHVFLIRYCWYDKFDNIDVDKLISTINYDNLEFISIVIYSVIYETNYNIILKPINYKSNKIVINMYLKLYFKRSSRYETLNIDYLDVVSNIKKLYKDFDLEFIAKQIDLLNDEEYEESEENKDILKKLEEI